MRGHVSRSYRFCQDKCRGATVYTDAIAFQSHARSVRLVLRRIAWRLPTRLCVAELDAHSGTAGRVSRLVRCIRERLKKASQQLQTAIHSRASVTGCTRGAGMSTVGIRSRWRYPCYTPLVSCNDECHYGEPSATFSEVGRVSAGAAAAWQRMSMSAVG